MNDRLAQGQNPANSFAVLARWFLGCVFVYVGSQKAVHPVDFLKLVRAYDVVHNHFLLNSIAAVLPWFEIYCGLLLLVGIAVRGTAWLLFLMLAGFTSLIIHRALDIMSVQAIPFRLVKFDCGCGTGDVIVSYKLLENCGLIILLIWLLFGQGRKFCLRYNL